MKKKSFFFVFKYKMEKTRLLYSVNRLTGEEIIDPLKIISWISLLILLISIWYKFIR